MNAHPSITPRPLHRSKTLWAGILVLTFLAWTWWYSLLQWNEITYHDYTLAHAGSGISLTDRKVGISKPLTFTRGTIRPSHKTWAHPRLEAPDLLRATGTPEQRQHYFIDGVEAFHSIPRNSAAQHFVSLILAYSPGSWGLFIPHWLILTLFLIPWLAFLLWRDRRLRHLTKPTP